MARRDETPRDLLFGLLALQVGLIDQDQLIGAFSAWSRNQGKALAEILLERGAIDEESRALLAGMAEKQLKLHGGDTEKSLAAVAAGPSTRQKLGALGDTDLTSSVAFVGSQATSPDASATMSIGNATSDGQRFRVLRPHAQGGLGAVFVALDGELNREVALKQILDHHADNEISRTRFMIEAEITGGLEHPGIVPVYGLGHDGSGRPYYAMRFIRGDSLKEAIAAFHSDESLKNDPGRKSLALRKLLRRFVDVCNAIDYAHGRGILHRDLKPGNVIVGRYGETLVVDWGLAKPMGRAEPSTSDERTLMPSSSSGSAETLPGSAIGTPAYMSPEQALGDLENLGPRSDVYSLGATLYCLLTGKAPFEGLDLGAILREVRKGSFSSPRQLDPTIDKALEAVCLKAMALKIDDRHASARALSDDIERWSADEPTSAWSEPFAVKARRWMRRNRTKVAVAAVALLATLFGTAAVLAVQTRANSDLKRSNDALNVANAKERQANADLAQAKDREAARFALAQDAIRLFHGEVGDDLILKEDQFKPLRDRLLQGAADFYGKLEKLLEGQVDPASRKSLAQAYFDLGELTSKIGDKTKALEAQRKSLAIRRELAAATPLDVAAQFDLAGSQFEAAVLLAGTGREVEALAIYQEARTLLEGLPRIGPDSEARRSLIGRIDHKIGQILYRTGKMVEALESYHKALAIQQELADANPAVAEFRNRLTFSHISIGVVLFFTGKPAEALESYRKALAIYQVLADSHPGVTEYRINLAGCHFNIGHVLFNAGNPAEALESNRKALAIRQGLVDANPAVTEFRSQLATSHSEISFQLSGTSHRAEAMESCRKALAIRQGLVDANPAVPYFRDELALSHNQIGFLLSETDHPAEAMESYRQALTIRQKLVDATPAAIAFRYRLAESHHSIAHLLWRTGHPVEALESCREALAIRQGLVDANPNLPQFGNDLVISHLGVGILLATLGRLDEALAEHQQAVAISQELVDKNPGVPDYRNNLASGHNNAAEALRALKRPGDAIAGYGRAIAIRDELVAKSPTDTTYRGDLASTLRRLGLARLASNDATGAIAETRKALVIYDGLPTRSSDELCEVACCHAALAASGRVENSGISAEDGEAEAKRAVEILGQAIAKGYSNTNEIRAEAAFDSLRSRADFQALMKKLEAPPLPTPGVEAPK